MRLEQILITAFSILFLFTGTIAYSQPVNEESCSSFFVVYCTTCHNTQRICTALETQNEEAWKKTIHTMAEYRDLDKNEEEQALACMNLMKPSSKIVCKQK